MNYDKVLYRLDGETVNVLDSDGQFAGVLRAWTYAATGAVTDVDVR